MRSGLRIGGVVHRPEEDPVPSTTDRQLRAKLTSINKEIRAERPPFATTENVVLRRYTTLAGRPRRVGEMYQFWFRTRGCTFDRAGQCSMCNYGVGPDIDPQLASYNDYRRGRRGHQPHRLPRLVRHSAGRPVPVPRHRDHQHATRGVPRRRDQRLGRQRPRHLHRRGTHQISPAYVRPGPPMDAKEGRGRRAGTAATPHLEDSRPEVVSPESAEGFSPRRDVPGPAGVEPRRQVSHYREERPATDPSDDVRTTPHADEGCRSQRRSRAGRCLLGGSPSPSTAASATCMVSTVCTATSDMSVNRGSRSLGTAELTGQ
jgi:hypothetical protein